MGDQINEAKYSIAKKILGQKIAYQSNHFLLQRNMKGALLNCRQDGLGLKQYYRKVIHGKNYNYQLVCTRLSRNEYRFIDSLFCKYI